MKQQSLPNIKKSSGGKELRREVVSEIVMGTYPRSSCPSNTSEFVTGFSSSGSSQEQLANGEGMALVESLAPLEFPQLPAIQPKTGKTVGPSPPKDTSGSRRISLPLLTPESGREQQQQQIERPARPLSEHLPQNKDWCLPSIDEGRR